MIWVRLLQLLQFRHHDFHKQYTPYYAMRINVHLDHLIRQGKLIRGDWFKKMWIGFMLVLKMATAWIKDAFENGTHSWDITISKLTSVLLQSALSSRSGDITRSQLYEGLECLCWGHIILKLESPGTRDNAPNVQDLKGIFELQFTKNKKYVENPVARPQRTAPQRTSSNYSYQVHPERHTYRVLQLSLERLSEHCVPY